MYTYYRTIRLQDTDATGVIFFAEKQKIALEALEQFLQESGFSLRDLLQSEYLLPIVHVEADYMQPLFVGDSLSIHLSLLHQGSSSFTVESHFFTDKEKKLAGRVAITHVVTLKQTGKSTPIPEFLRSLLDKLSVKVGASKAPGTTCC